MVTVQKNRGRTGHRAWTGGQYNWPFTGYLILQTKLGSTPQSTEMVSSGTVYYGAVINPQERNPRKPISYNAWPRCLLEISEDGKIVRIIPHVPELKLKDTLASEGLGNSGVVVLPPGEFIMPGFIDTHTVCLPYIEWNWHQTNVRRIW